MPIALKPITITSQFDAYRSVLIVPCHVCPRMCLAAQEGKPYLDLLPGKGRDSFTAHLSGMRDALREKRIRSTVFRSPAASPMLCLWPLRVRARLAREAKGFDAIAVIGCESATATVEEAIKESSKDAIQMMRNEGIANFIAQFNPPCGIGLTASWQGTVPWPGKTI